jgi:hypothetical protein
MSRITRAEQHVLSSYLRAAANKWNNAPLLNLEGPLFIAYEKGDADTDVELGERLAKVILDSHLIRLQEHQIEEFSYFWTKVVKEMRSE